MTGPSGRPLLDGVRVIEIGQVLAGPYTGMLLADLGADVVKVEPPEGDIARSVGTVGAGGVTPYFASLNRNKRSVVLDLGSEEGQQRLGELCRDADALVVNMKGSTVRKLGLTYDALRRWNEKLVCVAITGYGLDCSREDRPAFDYVIQAETGVAAMTGEPDGPPSLAGYSVVDNSVAVFAALGLVSAVLRGEGGQLDVSMHDVTLSQLNYRASAVLNGGVEPPRATLGAHGFYAPAQMFQTADGYLAVFVTHDTFWRRLAQQLGGDELATDPRFATMADRAARRDELAVLLSGLFRQQTTTHWCDLLAPLGIAIGPVSSLTDALAGSFVAEREMVVTTPTDDGGSVRTVGNPIKVEGVVPRYDQAPRLGEHDDDAAPRTAAAAALR